MKKSVCLLFLCVAARAFALNSIVYVDVEKVYASSKVMALNYAKEQQDYVNRRDQLKVQQLALESELSHQFTQPNSITADGLSLREKQLQENFDILVKTHEHQLVTLKNEYMLYVRKAAIQLQRQKHFQYVLSSTVIIASESGMDISTQVSQVADQLYTQARSRAGIK